METMAFRVVFDWTGDGMLMFMTDIKNKMQDSLVSMYNALISVTNAHLNEWNDEAHTKHPDSDGWSLTYMRFMRGKYQETLDKMLKNESFDMFSMNNDNVCTFSAYVGQELELHLKLEAKPLSSWIDVSFHLKAA